MYSREKSPSNIATDLVLAGVDNDPRMRASNLQVNLLSWKRNLLIDALKSGITVKIELDHCICSFSNKEPEKYRIHRYEVLGRGFSIDRIAELMVLQMATFNNADMMLRLKAYPYHATVLQVFPDNFVENLIALKEMTQNKHWVRVFRNGRVHEIEEEEDD